MFESESSRDRWKQMFWLLPTLAQALMESEYYVAREASIWKKMVVLVTSKSIRMEIKKSMT